MGQQIGRARLAEEGLPFANLSTEAVQEMWDKFNEVAEGFGISMDVFKSICGIFVALGWHMRFSQPIRVPPQRASRR